MTDLETLCIPRNLIVDGHVEEWKPLIHDNVQDYYMISNCARIYSKRSECFMRPILKHNGYYRVNLALKMKINIYKQREFSLHRLVALHFISLPDGYDNADELQVNHIHGDKSKNYAWELEWVTAKENIEHARRTGLQSTKFGIESPNNKYDVEVIRKICDGLEKGYRGKELLRYTGLDNSFANLVRRIRERRHWTHISKDYNF